MSEKLYEKSTIEKLSDQELLAILKDAWKISGSEFDVWGEIIPSNETREWGLLRNARIINSNKILTYPLHGFSNPCEFWISPSEIKKYSDSKISNFIKCKLELSPPKEREKFKVPFLMKVTTGSCEYLKQLPNELPIDIITDNEKSFFISKSIYEYYHKQAEIKIKQEFEDKSEKYKKTILAIENEIGVAEEKRDSTIQTTKILANKLNSIEQQIILLDIDKEKKTTALNGLSESFKRREAEMNHKINRLKEYISDKALFLKTFEFLDEDDLDDFIFESRPLLDRVEGISFQDALQGDYNKAVSYIQAHLVDNDILYPRHIIENYITLLRTKDLIILAGDSGSGKTNLVKSFAKAVGGKAIIIPVKPNWTSSEDLLGYYNPLERKYIATPFLDALLEARKNPDVPYFICLDEMNLARVEYYFADFLSLLESRDEEPEITLYVEDESSHVLSELKAIVEIIQAGKEKYSQDGIVNFIQLLQDENLNFHIRQAFGFSDKDSLIKYHSEIRRMLTSVMRMPSSIKMPANVYIIGAINIDETTHYLSPKILDRAHIMRFESPLLSNWDVILQEVDEYDFEDTSKPLLFEIEALGFRKNYPKFERDNPFCDLFIQLNKEFFHKLGVEFGMRTIRQGLNYLELFQDVNKDSEIAINNFLLHKVLPKMTFDGNKYVGEHTKLELIERIFLERIKIHIPNFESYSEVFSAVHAIENIVKNAKANDGVVNFWS